MKLTIGSLFSGYLGLDLGEDISGILGDGRYGLGGLRRALGLRTGGEG